MFERSEFPAVPLAVRDGRVSARSADARQGVFCFGYFHLDKQMKVTRAAARNPKPKFTRTVHPENERSKFKSFAQSTNRYEPAPSSANRNVSPQTRHT